ncbi:MAG: hypothetical protein NXI20_03145 [bacterium]|nr:hypothetical protein [bacterium]
MTRRMKKGALENRTQGNQAKERKMLWKLASSIFPVLIFISFCSYGQGGLDCNNASIITADGVYSADFSNPGSEEQWYSYTFPVRGTVNVTPTDCNSNLFVDWKSDCSNSITSYFTACGLNTSLQKETFTYLGEENETIYLRMDESPDFDDPPIDFAVATEIRDDIDTTLEITSRSYTFGGQTYSSNDYYELEHTFSDSEGQDSIVYLKLTIDNSYGTTYNNSEPILEDGLIQVDNLNLEANWFNYTAPIDGLLEISTCGYTTKSTEIELYDDNSSTNPIKTAAVSFLCDEQAVLQYEVLAGQQYWIKFINENAQVNEILNASVQTKEIVAGLWYGNPIQITEGTHTINHNTTGGDVYYQVDLTQDFDLNGLTISTCDAATENTEFYVYLDFAGTGQLDKFGDGDDDGVSCGSGLELLTVIDIEFSEPIIRFKEPANSSYNFELSNHKFCDEETYNNVTATDYYEFDGQTLTESGTYFGNFMNKDNCDSLATLFLTVNLSNSCDDPYIITTDEIFDVDNTHHPFWANYTNNTGNEVLARISTEGLAGNNDTYINLYDACNESRVTFDDGNNNEAEIYYTVGIGESISMEFVNTYYAGNFQAAFTVLSAVDGQSCNAPIVVNQTTYTVDNSENSAWYQYTFEDDGDLTINSCLYSQSADVKIVIYNDCGSIPVTLYDEDVCETYTFSGEMGETILIEMSDNFTTETYQFDISFESSNTCEIPSTVLIETLDSLYTMSDTEEWYEFTADSQSTYIFRTVISSGIDTELELYYSCDSLLLQNNDWIDTTEISNFSEYKNFIDYKSSEVSYELGEDQTVFLKVSVPDNFDKIRVLASQDSIGSSLDNAIIANQGYGNYADLTTGPKWFEFTPSEDRDYYIHNCGFIDSRIDTKLCVFYDRDSIISCVDDVVNTPFGATNSSLQNFIEIENAEKDHTYYMLWEGVNFSDARSVEFAIHDDETILESYPGESNQATNCQEATVVLDTGVYEVNYLEMLSPVAGNLNNRWFKYVSPRTETISIQDMHFDIEGDDYTLFKVYDNCSDLNDLGTGEQGDSVVLNMVMGDSIFIEWEMEDMFSHRNQFEIKKVGNFSVIDNTWTGAVSSNWFDASNWSEGEVPAISDNVSIPNTSNQPEINGDAAINDVTIDEGAVLTIQSGAALNIQGAVYGDGSAIVKRNTVGNAGYSIIGSPIQNAQIDDLQADYFYAFDGTNYVVPTGALNVGEGYFAAFNQESPFISFQGKLNSGAVEKSFNETGIFQLVSNPYAAAISWTEFLADNPDVFDGNIYLWDDGGFNNAETRGGGYVTVNTMGVTGALNGTKGAGQWTGNIGSMQGFYIYIDNIGEIKFNPTQQVSDVAANSDGAYYRRSYENKTISLAISNATSRDELIIGFDESATLQLDRGMDARKLRNNLVSFFSISEDEELAIQALPLDFNETIIPLGVAVNDPGQYVVSISNFQGINDDIGLKLIDNYLNTEYDLRENPVAIELTEKEYSNRFELRVAPVTVSESDLMSLSVVPSFESIQINYQSAKAEEVLITTVDGRTIFNDVIDFRSGNTVIHRSFKLKTIYLVKVNDQFIKFLISK